MEMERLLAVDQLIHKFKDYENHNAASRISMLLLPIL